LEDHRDLAAPQLSKLRAIEGGELDPAAPNRPQWI
jgi:hypothetical protein